MSTEDKHPEELLPWYVNNTLTEDERSKVVAHLKDCERCPNEVAYLKAVRSQVKAASEIKMYGVLGLKRLMSDIKKETKTPRKFEFSRWQSSIAIAASLIIILQGVILYHFWQQFETITTLSGPMHKGVVLQINFSPNAREVQIRKLLQSVDGSIIEGPGAIGIYRIRLNLETKNEEHINERIAALRSHYDTVIHVARE